MKLITNVGKSSRKPRSCSLLTLVAQQLPIYTAQPRICHPPETNNFSPQKALKEASFLLLYRRNFFSVTLCPDCGCISFFWRPSNYTCTAHPVPSLAAPSGGCLCPFLNHPGHFLFVPKNAFVVIMNLPSGPKLNLFH